MAIWFATFVLLGWVPVLLLIFASLPPRRAVIFATFFAWLFLPNVGFPLSGLPDYTKYSATIEGLLLGIFLFDRGRLFAFRLRWYDFTVLVWCFSFLPTAISNDLGLYEGLSLTLAWLILVGFSYFIGRLYFSDREGLRELALGLVLGGLVYVPLCLWEIRMSPMLQTYTYGVAPALWHEARNGVGYRPVVFMVNGLETSMFMCMAALTGFWLWSTRALKTLAGFPFGPMALALLVTAALCQSAGATILMAAGIVTLWLVRRTKRWWPVMVLLLLPFSYMTLRVTGAWSGSELVDLSRTYLGDERAHSLEFRLENEAILIKRALERPWFGWCGRNRNKAIDQEGKQVGVTDGYWIIALGTQGLVGLISSTLSIQLGVARLIRRLPPKRAVTPTEAPATALAVLIALYMIDNLSNAFINPIYMLAIGGLAGYASVVRERVKTSLAGQLDDAEALLHAGDLEAAAHGYQDVITSAGAKENHAGGTENAVLLATAHQSLGALMLAGGQADPAWHALAAAASLWQHAVAAHPEDPGAAAALADTYEQLARLANSRNLAAEAVAFWHEALALRERLAAGGEDPAPYAETLNDLAWLLAFVNDPSQRDPAAAVELAHRAVGFAPDHACYWNTLGAAAYQAGDTSAAIASLGHAVELGAGGTACDHYLLALAYARFGDTQAAHHCFSRAEHLAGPIDALSRELREIRDNAHVACTAGFAAITDTRTS